MNNILRQIINKENVEEILGGILDNMYVNGPTNRSDLEILSFIKFFHPNIFNKYENEVVMLMGLFFKKSEANSLRSLIMKNYGESILDCYGHNYTPVQMDIVNSIKNNKYFSFSSATSTGKSYVFRDLLINTKNDVIIVVPSRALINEYYIKVKEIFRINKVNILTYIDFINKSSCRRNIFIVTPERAKEVFKFKDEIKLDFVLFDEAQISDEKGSRGIIFDSLVRRIKNNFINTKMLFAFPYISNPGAQLEKNNLTDDISSYYCYNEKNVGQIFFSKSEDNYYAFGINKEILGNNRIKIDFDPIKKILENNGSVLIYTSKSKIISEKIIEEYSKYCNYCKEITDSRALLLINKFDNYMGTSGEKRKYGYSQMSYLLRRGIILHHGSLPLKARMIIEELTRLGFCNLCFSTSTLVQGINMPFDIVLLDRFENKPLEIKNLIGRAGRSSPDAKFDYGIIVVKDYNKKDIRNILCNDTNINAESLLDTAEELPEDVTNYRDAILNNTFNDEYNLPQNDLKKLTKDDVFCIAKNILDCMFIGDKIISADEFSNTNESKRNEIYDNFQKMYSYYLNNRELSKGEKSIISNCVRILLWQIQGKTFKQIVGYRYSYIRQNSKVKKVLNRYRNLPHNNINKKKFRNEINAIKVKSVMKCSDIPDKSLNFIPLFNYDMEAYKVNYDIVAFDTYDYIDKIIGFKLRDIYYAIFNEFFIKYGDERAKKMSQYIKYGSSDDKEIMLLRYGFDFETIEWLKDKVESIDENSIVFKNIDQFTEEQLLEIDNYL